MKRATFVTILSTLVSLPALAVNYLRTTLSRDKGFKIAAGEGRVHGHLKLKGVNANILDVKISGTDTEGDLAIFEQTSLSQGKGTPFHVHPNQDEVFYVIDGAYKFKVGQDLFDLKAGESIFLPRKIPHAWTQVSGAGKMIVILQPAGKLESFFVTMAALDHVPTPAEVARVFSDNEMEVVGPPLKLD
ncbi:MAG: cupin domain-containing protein [Chryseolinea sp.]